MAPATKLEVEEAQLQRVFDLKWSYIIDLTKRR
jgi:hypothetical protein